MRAGAAVGVFDGVKDVLAGDAEVIQTEILKLEKSRERQLLCS